MQRNQTPPIRGGGTKQILIQDDQKIDREILGLTFRLHRIMLPPSSALPLPAMLLKFKN